MNNPGLDDGLAKTSIPYSACAYLGYLMNNAKKLTFCAAAGLFAVTSINASSPLFTFGDKLSVYSTGSASLSFTDNLFYGSGLPSGAFIEEEIQDSYFTLAPGVDIVFGESRSNFSSNLALKENFTFYNDNDDLNSELFSGRFAANYKNPKLEGGINASLVESDQNSSDLNAQGYLLERLTTTAGANVKFRLSPKSKLSLAAKSMTVDYDRPDLPANSTDLAVINSPDADPSRYRNDRESMSFTSRLFYEYSPKLDISIGYAFRTLDTKPTDIPVVQDFDGNPGTFDPILTSTTRDGTDLDSHIFRLGVSGEILPKVSGDLEAGIQIVDPKGQNTSKSNNLNVEGSLTWAATPKIGTTLELESDTRTSSSGTTTEVLSAALDTRYKFSQKWSSYALLRYSETDYGNGIRSDESYMLGIGGAYQYNRHASYSAGYNYLKNNSTAALAEYNVGLFTISANFRY